MNKSFYKSFYFIGCLFFLNSCTNKTTKYSNSSNVKKDNNLSYYLEKGKLDSAQYYIDKLYEENPNNIDVLINRGEVYFLLNQTEVSELSWNKCLSIDLNNENCYEKLIGLYCGFYGLLEEDCTNILSETLTINQNNKVALFFKAKRFANQGNILEAINLYEDILEKDSKNLRILNELAILEDTGYRAEMYYRKMLNIDSSYTAFYGLGMYFQKKRKFQNALDNYNLALRIKDVKDSYYNMGYCYMRLNSFSEAINSFTKAIEIDGSYLQAYFARAYAYNQIGDKSLAIEDYKFCLMLEPGHGPAREELEKIK